MIQLQFARGSYYILAKGISLQKGKKETLINFKNEFCNSKAISNAEVFYLGNSAYQEVQYHCIHIKYISNNASDTDNKHEQLEDVIIRHVTYYIEHKRLFSIYRCQRISFVRRAECKIKTCTLRNKSVIVIVPK